MPSDTIIDDGGGNSWRNKSGFVGFLYFYSIVLLNDKV